MLWCAFIQINWQAASHLVWERLPYWLQHTDQLYWLDAYRSRLQWSLLMCYGVFLSSQLAGVSLVNWSFCQISCTGCYSHFYLAFLTLAAFSDKVMNLWNPKCIDIRNSIPDNLGPWCCFFDPYESVKWVVFVWPASQSADCLHGKNIDIGHTMQTYLPNLFILVLLVGTIDFSHVVPFSGILALA